MRLALVFAVSAALFWGGTAAINAQAATGCQPITVTNDVPLHVRPGALARDERAVAAQSRIVAAAWHVAPASFRPGGWPLVLRYGVQAQCGRDALGCHGASYAAGVYYPYLDVGFVGGWRMTLSHEVLETLVDPSYGRPEICDRYEAWGYRVRGVLVSDWMLPDRRSYVAAR